MRTVGAIILGLVVFGLVLVFVALPSPRTIEDAQMLMVLKPAAVIIAALVGILGAVFYVGGAIVEALREEKR